MIVFAVGSRAPIEESRRWGVYATVNLSLKTYFKVWENKKKKVNWWRVF